MHFGCGGPHAYAAKGRFHQEPDGICMDIGQESGLTIGFRATCTGQRQAGHAGSGRGARGRDLRPAKH